MKNLKFSIVLIYLNLFLLFIGYNCNSHENIILEPPEVVSIIKNNSEVKYFAYPGHLNCFIQPEQENAFMSLVQSYGAKILKGIPDVGYYHVKVEKGAENEFIKEVTNISPIGCFSPMISESISGVLIFDNFRGNLRHGHKVERAYKSSGYCQKGVNIDVSSGDSKINTGEVYRFLYQKLYKKDNQFSVINASFGVSIENDDFQGLSDHKKKIYHNSYKEAIINKLELFSKLQNNNFIFVQAAGNKKYPHVNLALSEIESEIQSRPELLSIFRNNYLVVSDFNSYANTGTSHHENLLYINHNEDGTSYAAPRASCIINEVANIIYKNLKRPATADEIMLILKRVTRFNSLNELKRDEAIHLCKKYISNKLSKEYEFKVESEINTNVNVNKGDSIVIRSSGKVTFGMFAGSAGPDGIQSTFLTLYNKIPDQNVHGALFMRIGNSEWIKVGNDINLKANNSGNIIFMINDDDTENNSGHFDVEIKVLSDVLF